MWIMTSYGILMPATIPADVRAALASDWDMQVRSRDRKTLVKLRRAMGGDTSRVVATPDMDYEFRLYVHASDFAVTMGEEIMAIDYEKFKPTTLRKGMGGERLHHLYNRIWGVVATHYDAAILGKYERRTSQRDRINWWEDK